MSKLRKSNHAIKQLHGVVAVYKPQNSSVSKIVANFQKRLLKDLDNNYHHSRVTKQFYLVNWKRDQKFLEENVLKPSVLTQNSEKYLTLLSNYFSAHSEPQEPTEVKDGNFVLMQKKLTELAFNAEEVRDKFDVGPAKLETVSDDNSLAIVSLPSLSNHPLVRGPIHGYIGICQINYLDYFTSGILLLSISPQVTWQRRMKAKFLQLGSRCVYEVLGEFGITTRDMTIFGHGRHTCSYHQVEEKWLKRKLTQFTRDYNNGVRRQLKLPRVEENFDLDENMNEILTASRSLRRRMLILHNVSLRKLNLPYVELQMELENSNGEFCRKALHQIAFKQRTFGCARKVTLTKIGPVTLEHTLVDPEINVENVIERIKIIKKLLFETYHEDIGYNLLAGAEKLKLLEDNNEHTKTRRLENDVNVVFTK